MGGKDLSWVTPHISPSEGRVHLMASIQLFAGVDGGATKTWAVVGDAAGRLLGFGAGGAANYHVIGLDFAIDSTVTALAEATAAACAAAKTAPRPPSAASATTPPPASILSVLTRSGFYLAGDDTKEDHARLGEALAKGLPPGAAYQWDNDCWAALRGGTRKGWGAVCIGGSGTNSAAVAPDGRRAILRGIGRDVGSPGGASDIARDAIFMAFRMDEGMRPKTGLHGAILVALELPDYDAAVREYMENSFAFGYRAMGVVTPLVFRLADEGDEVAQDILIEMGRLMGEQTGAVLKRAGIERLEADVVLAGSTYRGQSPLLIDSLTTAVHRSAPKATPVLPRYQPVVGGYLLALEGAGIRVGAEAYANLERSLPGLLPEPEPAALGELE